MSGRMIGFDEPTSDARLLLYYNVRAAARAYEQQYTPALGMCAFNADAVPYNAAWDALSEGLGGRLDTDVMVLLCHKYEADLGYGFGTYGPHVLFWVEMLPGRTQAASHMTDFLNDLVHIWEGLTHRHIGGASFGLKCSFADAPAELRDVYSINLEPFFAEARRTPHAQRVHSFLRRDAAYQREEAALPPGEPAPPPQRSDVPSGQSAWTQMQGKLTQNKHPGAAWWSKKKKEEEEQQQPTSPAQVAPPLMPTAPSGGAPQAPLGPQRAQPPPPYAAHAPGTAPAAPQFLQYHLATHPYLTPDLLGFRTSDQPPARFLRLLIPFPPLDAPQNKHSLGHILRTDVERDKQRAFDRREETLLQ